MFNVIFDLKKGVKKRLIRLIVSLILLGALAIAYIFERNSNGIRMLLLLISIIIFGCAMLFCRDASKSLRSEMPENKNAEIAALVMAIPQLVLGALFLIVGIIMPFVQLYAVIKDVQSGRSAFSDFLHMVSAFSAILIGYYMIYDGLGPTLTRYKWREKK